MRSRGVFGVLLMGLGCGEAPDGAGETGGPATSAGSGGSSAGVPTSAAATPGGGTAESTGDSGGADGGSSGETTDEASETTSGASETTGGVAGECADPLAPGCTACDAMGQPQRLFGLTWNFAQGEPGSGLGSEELRCVVPETGATGLIAAIPGMDWLQVGQNTYDREAGTLYAIAFANSDNIKRIFSIDTIAGALIANPPYDPIFNWSGGIHVRSDGALVGVTWNQTMQREELHVIDAATGQTTLVGEVPILSLYALYAFDAATDTALMVGFSAMGEKPRLFAVDAHDGTTEAPQFAAPPNLSSIAVRSDGAVLGVALDGGTSLVAIDRETAAVATIAALPDVLGVPTGSSVYDEEADVLFVVDGEHRLVSVAASTGETVAVAQLDGPPNPMYEYNWSGGLHVR